MVDENVEKNWFVVHTYSGYEHRVQENLQQRTQTMGMENEIFRVVVPEQEVTKIKDGQETKIVENDYPGYVLVEMATPQDGNMTDNAWYVVRNTPGVTGFLGSHGSGSKPTSLLPEEVDELMHRIDTEEIAEDGATLEANIGDVVKIIAGSFAGEEGRIVEINEDKKTVVVTTNIFGESKAELSFADVEPY